MEKVTIVPEEPVVPVAGETVVVVAEPSMQEVADGIVQPVATPVVEVAPITSEEGASPPPGDNPEDVAQKAIQKRINKITADKYAETRRADELQARLYAQEEAAKPVLPSSAPDIEDFDYDEDKHQEAVIQYHVQKALDVKAQESTIQQVIQDKEQIANDFFSKENEYANAHPDYVEVAGKLPLFGQETLSAIYQLGPQISHYLAKHLDVADEVANATPTMAMIKLGQISIGLTADATPVKTTTAPTPVKVITGGATVTKDMSDMSMDEIMSLP